MAVTWEQLRARVGAKSATEDDVTPVLVSAQAFYAEATEDAFREIPEGIADECVLSIGHALWDRRKTSGGVGGLTTVEGGAQVRAPRDPLASVRPVLANYVVGLA